MHGENAAGHLCRNTVDSESLFVRQEQDPSIWTRLFDGNRPEKLLCVPRCLPLHERASEGAGNNGKTGKHASAAVPARLQSLHGRKPLSLWQTEPKGRPERSRLSGSKLRSELRSECSFSAPRPNVPVHRCCHHAPCGLPDHRDDPVSSRDCPASCVPRSSGSRLHATARPLHHYHLRDQHCATIYWVSSWPSSAATLWVPRGTSTTTVYRAETPWLLRSSGFSRYMYWPRKAHWAFLTLSLPRMINFKFLLRPHRQYYITQYEELGFP